MIGAINRFPTPPWVLYLATTAFFVALSTGLQWQDGSTPVGAVQPLLLANDLLVVYGLVAVHLLKRAVRPTLETFRPALGDLERRFELLHYELTTLSRRDGIIALVIGATYSLVSLIQAPASSGITPDSSVASYLFLALERFIANAFIAAFILLALRQIVVIRRIHKTASNVTLLQGGAHNAFSRLTLRASVGVAAPAYIFTLAATASGGFLVGIGAADVFGLIAILGTATLLFFVPLYGMHQRLVDLKARASVAVNRSFERASGELRELVDTDRFDEIEGRNLAIESLVSERDIVRRASTWPWEGDTIRGFLSSIALPIFLWLVTTLLGRFLGA